MVELKRAKRPDDEKAIYDELVKEHGPNLTRPHLAP